MKFFDLLKNSVKSEEMTVSEADLAIKKAYLQHQADQAVEAQRMANTANFVYTTGITTAAGGASNTYINGPYQSGVGQLSNIGQLGSVYSGFSIHVSPPTGARSYYMLVDASGVQHSICLDSAHTPLIDIINNHNYPGMGAAQQASWYTTPLPAAPVMTDGEFSLDELGKAEEIIEEMAGQ